MEQASSPLTDAINRQRDLRAELFRVLKLDDLMSSRAQVPLDPQLISSEDRGAYTLKELAINSTPARTIKVLLASPAEVNGPVPAVVCIHGHGGNRHVVYDDESIYKGLASVLAAEGFLTIAADVGQHEVYEDGRILMGERLWDLIRCVDYLTSLPDVNASRIGCAGLSLGGEMAMWLGAMDTRIAATVSSGFLTFMDQMEQNHCMCWKFEGLRELVDYPDIYSLMAPRPLLCQNGLQEGDTQFCVPLARKAMAAIKVAYDQFGVPDLAGLDVHEGAHEINLPTLSAFFRKHLSSP